MDAFTDIVDIFTNSDADASVPIDEENASKGVGNYWYCVIA
jgi:hypothetical protein